MAAWSWKGPTGADASAVLTSRTPSATPVRSQRRAILLGERDKSPVRPGTRRPASVGEQHQRQQARDLPVAGPVCMELPREPDRLGAELDAVQRGARARGGALGEDQVQNAQDRVQPCAHLRLRGQRERAPEGTDPLLGAADALSHRGLGHQKRSRDLSRGQPANRAQRQRDLRRHGQRGMAAQQEQAERVVWLSLHALGRHRLERGGHLLPPCPRHVVAPQFCPAPGRDGDQPPLRVLRYALDRPLARRRQQGLLERVLAASEVAVTAHERCQHRRRDLTHPRLDRRLGGGGHRSIARRSSTGRSSTSATSASGTRAAISTARSNDDTSTR